MYHLAAKLRVASLLIVSVSLIGLGCSDSASPRRPDLAPAPNLNTSPSGSSDAEPVYNASTQTLLFQDNFDGYSTFSDAVANGWRCSNNSTTNDVTTNSAGACQIVTGMNGTGKALRLVYDGISNGAGQEAHAWGRNQSDNVAAKPGHAFYISFYFRITPGGGVLDDGSATNSPSVKHRIAIKWLQLWNSSGSDRAQFNTH